MKHDLKKLLRSTGVAALNDMNRDASTIAQAMEAVKVEARGMSESERAHFTMAVKEHFASQRLRGFGKVIDGAFRDAAKANGSGVERASVGDAIRMVEPSGRAVDGARLLTEIAAAILRFVCMTPYEGDAAALWVVHTFVFDVAEISPRFWINSPLKGCGKSTLLSVINALAYRPLLLTSASGSALFRIIERWRPTLLLDECDSFMEGREDLRNVLNTGFQRNGRSVRCSPDDLDPVLYSTWAPIALSGIGRTFDTVEDRAISVSLTRKGEQQSTLENRWRTLAQLLPLSRQAARWTNDNRDRIAAIEPTMPPGLHGRVADKWEILLMIADACGGEWPARARKAALQLERPATDGGRITDLAEQLLTDIAVLLSTGELSEPMSMREIVDAIAPLDDRRWRTLHGSRQVDTHDVGQLLRRLKIEPKTVNFGENRIAKGYAVGAFDDAFRKFLPASALASVTSVIDRKSQTKRGNRARTNVTVRAGEKRNDIRTVTRVTKAQGKP